MSCKPCGTDQHDRCDNPQDDPLGSLDGSYCCCGNPRGEVAPLPTFKGSFGEWVG